MNPFYNVDGYYEDFVDDTWLILACHAFTICIPKLLDEDKTVSFCEV